MKCLFPNNHVVAVVNGKNYVVDTGSPISFSYDNEKSITIGGVSYTMLMPIAPKDMVDQLTGVDISGFIGMDIIKKTNLTISKSEERIDFQIAPNANAKSININGNGLLGSFVVLTSDLKIDGRQANSVVLDTGACIGYVSADYLTNARNTGIEFHDMNPEVGTIQGELYETTISLGQKEVVLQVASSLEHMR